ncbi:MAG: hypothetical protein R2712_29065 [Vicinamibacterales bacterium]
MKSSERRHLQTNEFAEFVSQGQARVGEHGTTLLAAVAAVVVIGGGILGYQARRGA